MVEALDLPSPSPVPRRSQASEALARHAPAPEPIPGAEAPLPEDEVLRLSYGQIDDYETCPLKYRYVHVLRVPLLAHHAIVYGHAVHEAVRRQFEARLEGRPFTEDDLVAAFREAWVSEGFLSREHEDERLREGEATLRRFHRQEAEAPWSPTAVEQEFVFYVERNRVQGRYDLVVEREGRVTILDFKTGDRAATSRPRRSGRRRACSSTSTPSRTCAPAGVCPTGWSCASSSRASPPAARRRSRRRGRPRSASARRRRPSGAASSRRSRPGWPAASVPSARSARTRRGAPRKGRTRRRGDPGRADQRYNARRMVRPFPIPLALVALLLPPGLLAQEPTNRDQSSVTELHQPGFPIKAGVRAVPAAEARLQDGDLVIGLAIGAEARAYPINLMWDPVNEVLNDTLGGAAVGVTWCPLAHSAAAYDRKIGGRGLELGAVGLQNGVFILYDRQTGSWWSQVVGKAVKGPLEGKRLRKRPTVVTTWGRWRSLHPGTTVYVDPAVPGRRRFTEESMSRITLAGEGPVVPQDLVVAVEGKATAKAYLLRRLAGPRLVNDALDGVPIAVFLAEDAVTAAVWRRESGGRTLTFSAAGDRLRDAETGSEWDALTGLALSGPRKGQRLEGVVLTYALWYAWRSQRPDTVLWGEPR